MRNVQFRQANEEESRPIARFIRAMLKEMESVGGHKVNSDGTFWNRLHERIDESIRDGNYLHLFAQIGKDRVGFLEGKIQTLHEVFAPREVFHISAIYVTPDSRNQGIATSLMKEALRWASEQGCEEADLNVLVHNQAGGLYEKLGFQVFRREMRIQLSARHLRGT